MPVLAAGQNAVIATYTKALQDQLASVDLPILQRAFADDPDLAFEWAVLKGRNNYLCRQRINDIETGADQLDVGDASQRVAREVKKLVAWSDETDTGEIADVPFASPTRHGPRSASAATSARVRASANSATRASPRSRDSAPTQRTWSL